MRRRRWFLTALGVILLIVVGVGLFLRAQVREPWPQVDGEIHLSGLNAPVEVIRDHMGVPHIYAENTHDLFFAQGFVHAQDRFWQMEFWRRISSGRLAEILGESALSSDRFIRTLGWRQTAEADWAAVSTQAREAIEAYAEGVNAYLAEQSGPPGLEFSVLGLTGVNFEPEPWDPVDTIAWGKVMAWDLGGNMSSELRNARLTALLGAER